MLPRPLRLRSNQDFQRVYRAGRSWAHPLAALHVLAQPSGQRIGISVSKKVGGAVQRNRVRRRIREMVRAQAPGWRDGFDAVVVARAAAAEAEFAGLSAALEELARRAKLPREPGEEPGALYSMPTSGRAAGARPKSERG
jgi:ribonuclease P protein component